jgi:hypothetical protein
MNWWNAFYFVLSLAVMSTLPRPALMLMALLLLPVGLLWVWRWWADRQRSEAITAALTGSEYSPVPDRAAVTQVFTALDYPLRDWVMRGYPTGLTQYWVRDAWCVEHGDRQFTAMEVQTTPWYMGTGIPLWRVRHSALIVHSAQVWPEFVLWRDTEAALTANSGAKFQERRMGRKYPLLPIQGFWVEAEQPQRAWEQFFALWSKLGQAEDADLFAMTKDHDLVLFWRKRPPTTETLEQLLQGCLESIIGNGVPAQVV